jgi:hypothetical protein
MCESEDADVTRGNGCCLSDAHGCACRRLRQTAAVEGFS